MVAAKVLNRVGINDVPVGPEDRQEPLEIRQVIAKLDNTDEVELPDDLSDVMDGRFGAPLLPEFADVPGRDVQSLVELGGRDLCRLDSLACRALARLDDVKLLAFQRFAQIRRLEHDLRGRRAQPIDGLAT